VNERIALYKTALQLNNAACVVAGSIHAVFLLSGAVSVASHPPPELEAVGFALPKLADLASCWLNAPKLVRILKTSGYFSCEAANFWKMISAGQL
jgi:hypothetical protein